MTLGEHHYLDMADLLKPVGSSAYCAICNELHPVALPQLDVMFAGTSCKPNSTQRSGRFGSKPPSSHPDSFMSPAWLRITLVIRPRVSAMENVLGFLMHDSTLGCSPFDKLMDEVAAEAPMYSAAVFKVNNEEWLPWPRRRILIIHFDNEQADGPNSVLRASNSPRTFYTQMHKLIITSENATSTFHFKQSGSRLPIARLPDCPIVQTSY